MKYPNVIAIDTSITACGVAALLRHKLKFRTLRTTPKESIEERCARLSTSLFKLIPNPSDYDMAILEYPTFQQSAKGLVAAAGGGLIKIATVAGYLGGLLAAKGVPIRFVTPTGWKGMLTKDQTHERLLEHPLLGKQLIGEKYDHNVADAVAIIQWYITDHQRPSVDWAKAPSFKV